MTEAFIGQNVLITLKVPQGRTVEGVVSQVVPETSTLILRDGKFFFTSRHEVNGLTFSHSIIPRLGP